MKVRAWLAASTLSVAALCVAGDHDPDAPVSPVSMDLSQMLGSMAGLSLGGASDASPLPDFASVTKDMEKKDGMFILWSYSSPDKDQEKLLAQIPSSLLGEQFMLSTSFSGGGFFTGFPLTESVVRWELQDRQLVLVQPDTQFVVKPGSEVSDVVQRTYPERIRVAIPLVTKAPNGDPVIDLGALLKSDFADIGWTIGGGGFDAMGGFGRADINPALSKWTKKKTFELNTEIGVALAVAGGSPPGSYEKRMVHYSFWRLPQTDYTPRIADDRVGYFETANQDWTKPTDARDIYNRYINRWSLEKRDPSLEMCEPKQPITFYIEKTVPVKYRRAVRDGILEWNKAYEKLGFVNAVEVRQQTDDNEWKDLDPEDMRYSFFRWIVTGGGFAMGPSRANPFTGQIYDADIVFDDSMVRFYEQEADTNLPSTLVARKFGDPTLAKFLELNPDWARPARDWERMLIGTDRSAGLKERARARLAAQGKQCCDFTDEMRHEVAMGRTCLAGQPREVIDRFLYDVIKEVVMHEVGHTLGLRHNFKASSVYTIEEIQKRRATGEPTTGSVMDYNATLLFPQNTIEGYFLTPTIGPYDYWAIEYGYRPADSAASASKAGDKKDEAKPEGEQPKAEAASVAKAAPPVSPAPAAMKIDINQIPKEVRDQLPPEVRKAIESGDTAALMKLAQAKMGPGGDDLDDGDGGAMPITAMKAAAAVEFKQAPAGEEAMLQQIASRCGEKELAYATDEDTTYMAPDPTVNRFDMGRDPLVWAQLRIDLCNQRMSNALEWAVKDKESWYHLRSTFASLMFERARVLDFVGRFVGGQYFSRAHRGDSDTPPFVIVDADTQRKALQCMVDNLFKDEFYNISSEVLNHLAPSRWWADGAVMSMTMDFPIRDVIASMQWSALFDRLFPNTLRRIYDAELKTENALTLAEYIQTLHKAVWNDAADSQRTGSTGWTDNKPFVSSIRRSLQREYLGLMENLVREKPGRAISPDMHAMLRYSMQSLSADLGGVLKNEAKLDFASRAHLSACKSRIDRMLEAPLTENQPRMSFGDMFMRPAGESRN